MNDWQKIAEAEIEGLGENEDANWADYPIDTMLVRPESRTIYEVVRRIALGQFVMDPDFQRDFIWDEKKQSKLIESVLMRIPLPVFYLAENPDGKVVVVDGLQRLSTFKNFLDNKLVLKLDKRSELHGKKFGELSSKLKNRIEDCNLTFYILDAKVPEQARLDMFDRVNSGVPLSRQQMRNCLYTGEATKFLKTEAGTKIFEKATGGSLRAHKQMRDREFVNRFCAFRLTRIDKYRADMDEFLANALTRMNTLSPEKLNALSREFRTCLDNNWQVFGEHAFRKHRPGQIKRSVLNASIWDVMTTCLVEYPTDEVMHNAEKLRSAFYSLLEDQDFDSAVTYSTNGTDKVRCRFRMAKKMFSEVFGAH